MEPWADDKSIDGRAVTDVDVRGEHLPGGAFDVRAAGLARAMGDIK
jgi:hypothetical protein